MIFYIHCLFVFLVPFFEYGSYRFLPFVCFFSFLYMIKNKCIFINVKFIFFYFISTSFLMVSFFVLLKGRNSESLSLFIWSVSLFFIYPILNKRYLDKSVRVLFYFILLGCFFDYFAFLFFEFDFSSFFIGESRYTTFTKNYLRSTGFFSEPGTQAICLVILFGVLEKRRGFDIFFIFLASLLIKSPYMIFIFLFFLKGRFLLMFFAALPFFIFIMRQRISNIFSLNDSSFNARIESLSYLGESPDYYINDFLVSDIGLWADIYLNIGGLGVVYFIALLMSFPLILILKVKSFSGWLVLVLLIKYARANDKN